MKKILLSSLCFALMMSNAKAAPITVDLSELEEFSGLSRSEIIRKRYEAVMSSPLYEFLDEDYSHNPDVFQIQDQAPWISAHEISCYGMRGNKNISQGPSRESLGILNPELLLHLEILSYQFDKTGNGCSEVDYLIPCLVTYDEDNKRIKAYIDYSSFLKKNKSLYNISLMDANAHDLGYNYVFATTEDKDKLIWKSPENVTTSIIQTQGYYHLGLNVCQEIGGCNNYSPSQPGYDFHLSALPLELHFKLWKERPTSADNEADFNYHLIFE